TSQLHTRMPGKPPTHGQNGGRPDDRRPSEQRRNDREQELQSDRLAFEEEDTGEERDEVVAPVGRDHRRPERQDRPQQNRSAQDRPAQDRGDQRQGRRDERGDDRGNRQDQDRGNRQDRGRRDERP